MGLSLHPPIYIPLHWALLHFMVCTYTEKAGGTGDTYTVHVPKTCCFALVVAQNYKQNLFKLHLATVIFEGANF